MKKLENWFEETLKLAGMKISDNNTVKMKSRAFRMEMFKDKTPEQIKHMFCDEGDGDEFFTISQVETMRPSDGSEGWFKIRFNTWNSNEQD